MHIFGLIITVEPSDVFSDDDGETHTVDTYHELTIRYGRTLKQIYFGSTKVRTKRKQYPISKPKGDEKHEANA